MKLLTAEQEIAATPEQLFDCNIKLINFVLRRSIYRHQPIPLEDMQQEALIALWRAANLWDRTRGIRFATYAIQSIVSYLGRRIAQTGRMIRRPNWLEEKRPTMKTAEIQLTQKIGRVPTYAELAEYLGWPVFNIIELKAADPASMDRAYRPDSEITLHDVAGSTSNTEAAALATIDSEALRDALQCLTPTQRTIIINSYAHEMTLQEIGKMIGITRESVRQQRNKALRKLRAALEAQDRPAPQISAAWLAMFDHGTAPAGIVARDKE